MKNVITKLKLVTDPSAKKGDTTSLFSKSVSWCEVGRSPSLIWESKLKGLYLRLKFELYFTETPYQFKRSENYITR